jgi:hypothetical protein
MSDVKQCCGKRIRKSPAAEGQSGGLGKLSPAVEPEPRPASQESEADRLLRKIFSRSGPLPMAPEQEVGK